MVEITKIVDYLSKRIFFEISFLKQKPVNSCQLSILNKFY